MNTLVLGLALALPGLFAGTTVLPLTRAELAARSDTVVRAKVQARNPVRSERTGRILTRTRLEVLQTYKGAARSELELEQMGGTLEGATLVVPGDARLEVGEEVVLLLRCHQKPRCHLLGLSLGKFGVRQNENGQRIAVRDLAGLSDTRGSRLGHEEISLATLERELRRRP